MPCARLHDGAVADVLCSSCIGQRRQRFFGRGGGRRAAGDHEYKCGAPQAVHEQPRQLAVPVRHMRTAPGTAPVVGQRRYDLPPRSNQLMEDAFPAECASLLHLRPRLLNCPAG